MAYQVSWFLFCYHESVMDSSQHLVLISKQLLLSILLSCHQIHDWVLTGFLKKVISMLKYHSLACPLRHSNQKKLFSWIISYRHCLHLSLDCLYPFIDNKAKLIIIIYDHWLALMIALVDKTVHFLNKKLKLLSFASKTDKKKLKL